MNNSDVKPKEMCIKYLENEGYSNLKVVKHGNDIEGQKNGIKYYFEVKSSSRKKNEPFGGTVMLTQLNKAITNKYHYKFILCKRKSNDLKNWDFYIFEVDEFIKYCALTTPIFRYAYHPNPKKQPQFKDTTRTADKLLIENMWNAFEKWSKPNMAEVEQEAEKEVEKIENSAYIFSYGAITIKSSNSKCFYKNRKIKFFSIENSQKKEYRFLFKYSKQYPLGNAVRYWYSITQSVYKQMLEQKLTHLFLLTEQKELIKLPIEVFNEYLEFASIGKKGEYHIAIKREDDKLFLSSQGVEIPLDEYIYQYK